MKTIDPNIEYLGSVCIPDTIVSFFANHAVNEIEMQDKDGSFFVDKEHIALVNHKGPLYFSMNPERSHEFPKVPPNSSYWQCQTEEFGWLYFPREWVRLKEAS